MGFGPLGVSCSDPDREDFNQVPQASPRPRAVPPGPPPGPAARLTARTTLLFLQRWGLSELNRFGVQADGPSFPSGDTMCASAIGAAVFFSGGGGVWWLLLGVYAG